MIHQALYTILKNRLTQLSLLKYILEIAHMFIPASDKNTRKIKQLLSPQLIKLNYYAALAYRSIMIMHFENRWMQSTYDKLD